MVKIKTVEAHEILDSRGDPTVEVDLALSDGSSGRAAVPSGASTGSHEAIELRDGDPKRYGGKGVLKAIENVNGEIAGAVVDKDFDQKTLDHGLIEMDGTPNKSRLGANAILGVSMAFAKAAAAAQKQPLYGYFKALYGGKSRMILPVPMMNIMNGGRHADNGADIQEYMIVPHGFKEFPDALRAGSEVFHALKKILEGRGLPTTVGDEGGFAPSLPSNAAPLDLMMEAIKAAGYEAGKEISLAIDAAATEFYKDGTYHLGRDGKTLSSQGLIGWYEALIGRYPIVSIEDGLAEDDWEGWTKMTARFGDKMMLVGDDLFVTNKDRLREGVEKRAANSILIKLNQIGTVTETLETMLAASKAGYSCIVSHRSGETEDATIADLAAGTGTGYIKAGSISRAERTAKYDRLLRIGAEMGNDMFTAFPQTSPR